MAKSTPELNPHELRSTIITGGGSVAELLGKTTPTIERIISTEPQDFVLLMPSDLEQFIFDELYQRTVGKAGSSAEHIHCLRYISHLIAQLRTPMEFDDFGISVTGNKYVTDALGQGDPQLAGDNAVYGFVHFVGKRKSMLTKEDYINLAERCYANWGTKKPESIGSILNTRVGIILRKMGNWRENMMMRVPGFSFER